MAVRPGCRRRRGEGGSSSWPYYHLMWLYCLTVSEFSCLAKSYSVSGLTPMPHIPNQHHFTQKSAHEVLVAIFEARVSPVVI